MIRVMKRPFEEDGNTYWAALGALEDFTSTFDKYYSSMCKTYEPVGDQDAALKEDDVEHFVDIIVEKDPPHDLTWQAQLDLDAQIALRLHVLIRHAREMPVECGKLKAYVLERIRRFDVEQQQQQQMENEVWRSSQC